MELSEINKNNQPILTKYIKESKQSELYHYTSLEGLKSIIENANLWFSDIDYLNDVYEIKYGFKMVNNYIEEYQNNYTAEFCKALKTFCVLDEKSFVANKEKLGYRFFVLSFSNDGDSLPMWNYYSKSSNLLGYSLQFQKNLLLAQINNLTAFPCYSGNVVYNKSEQEKAIKCLINNSFQLLKKDPTNNLYKHVSSLFSCLIIFSLFTKNSFFMHEKEYRIVIPTLQNNKLNIKFRISNNLLITYISLDFSNNKIKKIILSPTQKNELIKTSLNDFCKVHKYNKIEIFNSVVSLRY